MDTTTFSQLLSQDSEIKAYESKGLDTVLGMEWNKE